MGVCLFSLTDTEQPPRPGKLTTAIAAKFKVSFNKNSLCHCADIKKDINYKLHTGGLNLPFTLSTM